MIIVDEYSCVGDVSAPLNLQLVTVVIGLEITAGGFMTVLLMTTRPGR